MNTSLGDFCKAIERESAHQPVPATGWICARLDGHGFSRLTRPLHKPFDPRLAAVFHATVQHLMAAFTPTLAYHQSDEISLFWAPPPDGAQRAFGTRAAKWLSLLPSSATSAFMHALHQHDLSALARHTPHMDARLLYTPDVDTAGAILAWRAQDARRNAVQGAAQCHYSQRALHQKNQPEMRAMLHAVGVDIAAYPPAYTNGSVFTHHHRMQALSPEERARIPTPHQPPVGALFRRRSVGRTDTLLPDQPSVAAGLLRTAQAQDLEHHTARRARQAQRPPQ